MHAEHTEQGAFAADFRVGEWLVEPSLDRLSRHGTVLRLRPQLTDLLVLLARHAGQTVSKNEILANVWSGQFVAESGMTRCIAELRQALNDDAREPKIVETIPKRGYRLVAPVAFLDTSSPSAPGEDLDPAAAATEPAGHPSPSAAATPEPPPPRRRTGWMVVAVLGLAGLLVVTGGAASWNAASALTDRDTVLLADVANTTGDAAFDQTLRLALAVHLGQAPFLHILSADHVRAALTLMGRSPDEPVIGPLALDVCRREGAAVLLAGSIARMGSHYAVGLEAIACRSGESLGRELLEVQNKDEVLTALGTGAGRLRRLLGESRASLRQYDVPIARATTPSLDALKALSLGDASRDRGRLAEALTFYRRATELDPMFALAWARRGAVARNLGVSVGDPRFGEADEPTLALRKAYELRDRVSEPERFYILGHYYRLVVNDPDKAVETYRMWKRVYPGSVVPPNNLASLYLYIYGQYDAGLPEAREAARLAPYSSLALSKLVLACLGTDRIPEAKAVLRDADRRGVADRLLRSQSFQIAFAEGDEPAMLEQARWAAGDPLAAIAMTQYRALAAASTGRLRESRRLWSDAIDMVARGEASARQADIRVLEAETEALLGDPDRARAAADAARGIDDRAGTLLSAAIALALSGEPSRARLLIDEASARARPGICSTFVWRPVGRALVEAAAGRFDLARDRLLDVARFERGRDFHLAPLGVRARIELTAGRPTEAAGTFRELLRLRAVAPVSPWVAFARLGLARALRDAGDTAGSLAAYDAVLASLTNADADAPLLVAARRERAQLGGR